MSTTSRIPPLLQPHTKLPENDSIILITSTLGASANWLTIRFLCEAFGRDPAVRTGQDRSALEDEKEDIAVILVSFMRNWEFWRSEGRKAGGLDLERLKRDKKLAFVDGMTKMFLPDIAETEASHNQGPPQRPVGPGQTPGAPLGRAAQSLPARGPPVRTDPRLPTKAPTIPSPAPVSTVPSPSAIPGDFFMKSAGIHDVVQTIESAIRHVKSSNPQRRTLLVLDTPSFLLASNPTLNPSVLSSTILRLHALTSHVLVHLPADDALISLSVPPQPLEVHAHNLLVKVAHMSRRILSCRVLDTGFAKDVSGVLRITENSTSGNLDLKLRSGAAPEEQEGTELLYLVKGDGSVKMFERGTGGEV